MAAVEFSADFKAKKKVIQQIQGFRLVLVQISNRESVQKQARLSNPMILRGGRAAAASGRS